MSDRDDRRRRTEADVRSCYSTWAGNYFDDYYSDSAVYPPVHQKILHDLIRDSGARSLLDAGCGPASMLRTLNDLALDIYGFDLTPEMIDEARRVMSEHGVAKNRFWTGNVAERSAYFPPAGDGPAAYDAAICVGVLPHIDDDAERDVFDNLYRAVAPGGLVAVEARNQLFALFTLNRYSRDYFKENLIDGQALLAATPGEATRLEAAFAELDQRFRVDLPPVRKGREAEPGYDEVLSRTHNPLTLKDRFAAAGFGDVRTLFYHYHCLPPMLEHHAPELFRRQSLAMEDPDDWRGYFMASAFIMTGKRL